MDPSTQIVQSKTYKAPKSLLLRMWSNPEHLSHWWGSIGFTTTTHEMDFKPDGIWRFTMHGPQGRDFPSIVRYRSISKDQIEYDQMGDGEHVDYRVKVSFVERDGETDMNYEINFPSAIERDRFVTEVGAEKRLSMSMDRLVAYASTQSASNIELVIVRRFRAPLDAVWNALTDEKQIAQWHCPAGLTMERSSGDLKPGGSWNAKMVTPSGYAFEVEGEYLDIEPRKRLQFSHRWKKDDGTYKPTTLIDIKLHEFEGKTTMTFVQSGFWSEESRAAHLGGWSNPFQKLSVLLGSATANKTLSLTREFAAPIELVWKCWTEAERFGTWFVPRPYTCPVCEIDLRPGGRLYLVMRSPDGMEHPMVCEITDIEPLHSFGWVNSVPGPDGEMAMHGGTNVFFEDLGGRTKVTVHSYAEGLTEMGAMMIGGMEMGWNMTLDQMVEACLAG